MGNQQSNERQQNWKIFKNIFTPILGEILTEEQKEAINNYKSVSDELNNWKEKFGNKTPSEVFNSQGFSLTLTKKKENEEKELFLIFLKKNNCRKNI